MKIKKFGAMLLCLALLLTTAAFAACGPKEKPVDPPTPEVTLSKIEITNKPTKTDYFVGETFDSAGMVVTATYSDGSHKTVTDYTCAPSGKLAVTDKIVTVTYQTKTATQAVTVKEKESEPATLSKIEITNKPTKTEYFVGETFDPAGMVVTATYSDKTTAAVTEYTYAPDGELAAGDTQITVTYKGQTATQAITVSERLRQKYIFEAEAAELEYVNSKWQVRSVPFTADINNSGTGYLASWKGNGKGNKIKFNVTSDADASAVISLKMALRIKYDIWIGRTEKGNKMFSALTLRGEPVTLPDDYFPKNPDAPDQTVWMEKEIATVKLAKGENVFEFTVDSDEMYWDDLALTTTADVRWTREVTTGHHYCDWKVTSMPSDERAGAMYRYCDICCAKDKVVLPALSTADAYTSRKVRQATDYLAELTTYAYHADGGDLEFTVISAAAAGTALDNKIEAESAVISGDWGDQLVNTDSTVIGETEIEFIQLNKRKGRLTYDVEASQAATVTLVLRIAPYNTDDIKINNVLRLTVNGDLVGMEDLTIIRSPADDWFAFDDSIVATFDVGAGDNTISFDALGTFSYNFDYMLLRSAASITIKA